MQYQIKNLKLTLHLSLLSLTGYLAYVTRWYGTPIQDVLHRVNIEWHISISRQTNTAACVCIYVSPDGRLSSLDALTSVLRHFLRQIYISYIFYFHNETLI